FQKALRLRPRKCGISNGSAFAADHACEPTRGDLTVARFGRIGVMACRAPRQDGGQTSRVPTAPLRPAPHVLRRGTLLPARSKAAFRSAAARALHGSAQ